MIEDGSFKDLDFEVSFHGLKIAEGFVLSMPTARACLVSSQQDRSRCHGVGFISPRTLRRFVAPKLLPPQ